MLINLVWNTALLCQKSWKEVNCSFCPCLMFQSPERMLFVVADVYACCRSVLRSFPFHFFRLVLWVHMLLLFLFNVALWREGSNPPTQDVESSYFGSTSGFFPRLVDLSLVGSLPRLLGNVDNRVDIFAVLKSSVVFPNICMVHWGLCILPIPLCSWTIHGCLYTMSSMNSPKGVHNYWKRSGVTFSFYTWWRSKSKRF